MPDPTPTPQGVVARRRGRKLRSRLVALLRAEVRLLESVREQVVKTRGDALGTLLVLAHSPEFKGRAADIAQSSIRMMNAMDASWAVDDYRYRRRRNARAAKHMRRRHYA